MLRTYFLCGLLEGWWYKTNDYGVVVPQHRRWRSTSHFSNVKCPSRGLKLKYCLHTTISSLTGTCKICISIIIVCISVQLLRNHDLYQLIFRPAHFFLHGSKAIWKDNETESHCINSTNHWAESDNQKGGKCKHCSERGPSEMLTLIYVSKPAVIYQLCSVLLPVNTISHLKPKTIVLPFTIASTFPARSAQTKERHNHSQTYLSTD